MSEEPNTPKYKLSLMFEWGGGCLWPVNDLARKELDFLPIEEGIDLPKDIQKRLWELTEWHDTALDWEYPPDPSPWTKEEFEEFEVAAKEMLARLQVFFGDEYEIIYDQLGWYEE